ncbi:GlxA family transcriptional regulator [Gallaecimonas pentaromativorans]|uniref:AraC family transcriptional regulator with amidase-like domain n=1 Tax=Gallaecimonas pentaromativorans TaxID=584787 RepID=A0A3N1PBJ4_9GAMM|nr:GlxA family transcriptional regulator [Gallaecimonas pentaromativorans]ROQ28782.1 AraC family transcriptional regulator with amidase-like domain [Gallaecimonas pentaromativorans]
MHKVGFIVEPGFQILSLSAQAVFEYANKVAGEPFYQISLYSLEGGSVASSLGFGVDTQPLGTRDVQADTWIVTGVNDPLNLPASPQTLVFLQRVSGQTRRLAAICTGAYFLAQAGLLDGRRATTHWALADIMQQQFPKIAVDANRIYISDGHIWTSAGMTAGLDMALAMVEKDLGNDVARSVAHKLVMNQKRAGGQSQHSQMLALSPKSDRIQSALDYARNHLRQPLTVDDLAAAVHLSPRQFSRIFKEETGKTPAKGIELLRLEAARLMIEKSRHSLDVVARETGFRDRRHMREVFVRSFGLSPQLLRQQARAEPIAG